LAEPLEEHLSQTIIISWPTSRALGQKGWVILHTRLHGELLRRLLGSVLVPQL
jgi:hypothetical protein